MRRCSSRFYAATATAFIVLLAVLLAPSAAQGAVSPSTSASKSCGSAGYDGPWGCVLISGSSWAPSLAHLGNLNVYNNGTNLNYFGPDKGYSWEYQCTELAIRYAAVVWGEGANLAKPENAWKKAGWTGSAQDMWSIASKLPVPLKKIANGKGAPQFGDLIIFGESGGPGHVGVVVKVSHGRLYFVGENQYDAPAEAWIPINSSNHASPGGDFSGSLEPLGWLKATTTTVSSWKASEAPVPANSGGRSVPPLVLGQMSCAAGGTCVAIGKYYDTSGYPQGLIETLSGGTWTVTDAPLPGGIDGDTYDVGLESGNCSGERSCFVVGWYSAQNSSDVQGLIETLTDGTWTASTAPLPGSADGADIESLTCLSAGSCIAIGVDDATTGGQGLVETLADGTWTPTQVPLPTNDGAFFVSIACPSAKMCVAVGNYSDASGDSDVLIESLSDGKWKVVDAPQPAHDSDALDSVSCASTESCAAVGDYFDDSGAAHILSETLSGTTWSASEPSLPANAASSGDTVAGLESVSCPSVGVCSAVGNYLDSAGANAGMIARLSDGNWTVSEAPTPSGADAGEMGSIACPSAGDCVAVGDYSYTNDGGNGQGSEALIETSDGGAWAASESPLPSNAAPSEDQGAGLDWISCPPSGGCSAIGQYDDSDGDQLIFGVTEQ